MYRFKTVMTFIFILYVFVCLVNVYMALLAFELVTVAKLVNMLLERDLVFE